MAVSASPMVWGEWWLSPGVFWWCMSLLNVSSSQSCPVHRKTGWRVCRYTVAVSSRQLARPCSGCRTGLAPSSKEKSCCHKQAPAIEPVQVFRQNIVNPDMDLDVPRQCWNEQNSFKEERLMWIMRLAHGYSMILVDPPNWEYSVINSGDTSLLLYFFFQMRAMVFLSERVWINCELSQGGTALPLRASYYIVDCCEFSGTFLWSTLWGGQGEKLTMGRNCMGLLLVSQTICRPQNSLGKILGMRLWEGRVAVRKKGWSGAGRTCAWVCL